MINKLPLLLLTICFLTAQAADDPPKTCADGKWLNDKTCIKCLSSCKTCKNLDGCTSCELNTFLHKNYCRKQCPKPLYGIPAKQTCVAKCGRAYIFHEKLCIVSCPDNKIVFKNAV